MCVVDFQVDNQANTAIVVERFSDLLGDEGIGFGRIEADGKVKWTVLRGEVEDLGEGDID